MKKMRKKCFVLLFVCLLLGFPIQASAVGAEGTTKYVTVLGYKYGYKSSIYKDSYSVWAYTSVSSPNHVNFPVGYYGLRARMYNSSGTLVKSSSWYYNDSLSGGFDELTPSNYASGTYYSKGQVKFYNGNGYNSYICNSSPNLSRSISIPNERYQINKKGMTFGSDYYATNISDAPDLTRVVGENGIEGYVLTSQLDKCPNTYMDVMEYIQSGQKGYEIPVYDSDTTTIVDTFLVVKYSVE